MDRNLSMGLDGRFKLSLSARRAWIEIACKTSITFETWASLSARRAWIEIILGVVRFSDITSRSPQGERG